MKLNNLLESGAEQFFDKPAPSKIKLLNTLSDDEIVANRQVILNILSNTLNIADVELLMARIRGDDTHGDDFDFQLKIAQKMLKTIPGVDVKVVNNDKSNNPRYTIIEAKIFGKEHGKPVVRSRVKDPRLALGNVISYFKVRINRKGTTWIGEFLGYDTYMSPFKSLKKVRSEKLEVVIDAAIKGLEKGRTFLS